MPARPLPARAGGWRPPRCSPWPRGGLLVSSSSSAGGATATSSGTASAAQADVSSVTLHIGDQAGTGAQALLTAAGLIDKLPFKVAWSDFTSGPPILQAMGAGAVDVGGVGNAPPVFAAAGGDKIAIVGALQANPKGSALLVPKGSAIHSVSQLKGKRIAVAAGQLGRLPSAHRAEQGRPQRARRHAWSTCSRPTAWPR